MKLLKKTIFLFFISFLTLPTFAYSKKDLLKSVQENSTKDVKKILIVDYDLATARYDDEKNTILMLALQNKANDKIIDVILKAGCSPTAKNSFGQTALMFACENSYNEKVITQILNCNTLTKAGKIKKILQCDDDGKNAFDYAKDNKQAYDVLLKYTQDPKNVKTEEPTKPEEVQPEQELSQQPVPSVEETPNIEESLPKGNLVKDDSIEETLPKTVEEPIEKIAEQVLEPVQPSIIQTPEPIVAPPVVSIEPPESTPVETTTQPEMTEQPSIPIEQVNETVQIDTVITVPPIDYYNKNKPEYLFDQIDAEHEISKELGQINSEKFTIVKSPDTLDNNGRTRLMAAIMNQDLKLCYDLINSGANVNYKDKEGLTPLMYACKYSSNPNIVNLLFSHNAKINEKTNYQISTLQILAAFCKNKEIVSIVLSKANQENIDILESFITALKEARNKEIIVQYMPYIKNINVLYKGKTPLMYCAQYYEDTEVIKYLLENKADPYIISSEKKNAFGYAKQNEKLVKDSVYWSLNVSTSDIR